MSNDRISDLTTAGPLTGAELFELSQPSGGTPPYNSRKQQLSILAQYIQQQLGGGAGSMGPPGLDGADGDDLLMIPGPAGTGGGGGTQNTYLLGNVGPDTHPANPTARDDEFEGVALGTKWTQVNFGSSGYALGSGSMFHTGASGGVNTNNTIYQPIPTPAAHWKFRTKMVSSTNVVTSFSGICAVNAATGKGFYIGLYTANLLQIVVNAQNTYGGAGVSSPLGPFNFMFPASTYNSGCPVYLDLEYDGAGNLRVSASLDGVNMIFLGSTSTAGYSLDSIGLFGGANSASGNITGSSAYDWFRDYTNGYAPSTGLPAAVGNITPDSHPLVATAWDDEFEYGASMDTAGARFSGANPWILENASGVITAPLSQGALQSITGTGTTGTSGFGYVQALPAGTWEFTVKLTKGYVEIFNLGTWEGIYFGNAGGSSFVVQYENRNWATGAYTYGGAIGSFTGNGLPVYLKIKSDGTTLSFSYSFSGLNIDYTACGSQAIATNLGSATYIGLGNGANTGIDWFRRTA